MARLGNCYQLTYGSDLKTLRPSFFAMAFENGVDDHEAILQDYMVMIQLHCVQICKSYVQ